jgi:hypothetical protein
MNNPTAWRSVFATTVLLVGAAPPVGWAAYLSEPREVSWVGQCDTPGNAVDVAVAGNLAYGAFGNDGLGIQRYDEPLKSYLPLIVRSP